MAREMNPALAVLDIRMPDMDGFELMARLKAEGQVARCLEPLLPVLLQAVADHPLDFGRHQAGGG